MLKENYKVELLKLAGENVSLEDMVNEAVRRFIEYSHEENITKYGKIARHEMLMGYGLSEIDLK